MNTEFDTDQEYMYVYTLMSPTLRIKVFTGINILSARVYSYTLK